MLGLGLVYRRIGLLEEAIFWLEKCIASDEHPAAAVSALAQACAQTPRVEQGIAVLERALDAVTEPKEQRIVMMTLGQLYLNHGRAAEGHAMLKKALGDDPAPKAS
jgi:tetratricopeptide (TPR) repeat protein